MPMPCLHCQSGRSRPKFGTKMRCGQQWPGNAPTSLNGLRSPFLGVKRFTTSGAVMGGRPGSTGPVSCQRPRIAGTRFSGDPWSAGSLGWELWGLIGAESAGIPNTRFRWSWWFPSMPRVIRSPAPWTPPNTGVHRHCTDRLGGKSHTSPPGPTGKPRSRLRGGPAGPTRWRSGPPNTPHNKRSTFGWVYPILSHLNTNCGGVDPAFKFASYGSRQRTDCADDCYHWRFHLDTQHT